MSELDRWLRKKLLFCWRRARYTEWRRRNSSDSSQLPISHIAAFFTTIQIEVQIVHLFFPTVF